MKPTSNPNPSPTERIRALNDAFRQTLTGGKFLVTRGVMANDQVPRVLAAVTAFDAFTMDNDPHDEHDFGAFEVDGVRHFWKIDYYALDEQHGSPDPADPAVTVRVLTIMLADEY